jgi:exonuclease 3'-5' domain-containing protein 2
MTAALKKPLYENCKVRNKDGIPIFMCSKKRAHWYVKRNLAAILNDDPLEIQLSFIAKGHGHKDDQFYLQYRENICVVCGSSNDLNRHHILPFNYRRHLPDHIKNNNYYDILLLCLEHHEAYEIHAFLFKKQLSEEYNVPVDGVWITDKESYKDKHKAKMIARTLLEHTDKIPQERKEYLLNKIRVALGIDVVNLEEVAAMEFDTPNIQTQGKLIVDRLTNLDEFVIRWREHFIEVMQPKFLPEYWDKNRGIR